MNLPVLSHTFLSNYENCPRKAWHLYVAKDLPREPPSFEMQYGIVVHNSFERALKANRPEDVPAFKQYVHQLLGASAIKHFEWSVAITRAGTPVDFWHPMAWLRGKLDVALVAPPHAMIVDWKTGKVREDPSELRTFAVLLKAHYPHVEHIGGSYLWCKTGEIGQLHDLSDTRQTQWEISRTSERVKEQFLGGDTEWDATPNPLCGWCPVKSCEHWRERK